MKQNRPSFQIVLKYALLQIPSLIFLILALIVLRQWFDIPAYLAVGFIGLWAAKDVILFPFLWRYYDADQFPDRFAMVNRTGLAISRLEPDGYVQVRGERWWARTAETGKPSKSKGNVLDPYELAGIYGVDALRYFLLKEISFGLDGSFSHELMTKTFNSDLSNDIGNLLSRSLAMVSKYRDGRIPRPSVNEAAESQIIESWQNLQKTVDEFIKWLDFRNGLDSIWSFINDINKYVDSSAPWALARDSANSSKLDTVLYTICESLRLIAMLVFSVIPSSAQKIWDQLGINEDISNSTLPANGKWGLLKPGTVVGERQPIFPRIEKDSNR